MCAILAIRISLKQIIWASEAAGLCSCMEKQCLIQVSVFAPDCRGQLNSNHRHKEREKEYGTQKEEDSKCVCIRGYANAFSLVYGRHGGKKQTMDPHVICKRPCYRNFKRRPDSFFRCGKKEGKGAHTHACTRTRTHTHPILTSQGALYSKYSSHLYSRHQESLKHPWGCQYISKVKLTVFRDCSCIN